MYKYILYRLYLENIHGMNKIIIIESTTVHNQDDSGLYINLFENIIKSMEFQGGKQTVGNGRQTQS